ncbi:MAG: hypothetical protein CM15mP125_2110 [Gammaproteobacteria bacterium]|nr:MAG: hypothetical protein CM15mP125_2110 [Gammaproteobacteria bacterium]
MKQEQAVQGIQSDIERLRLQETETSVRLETLAEEITKRDAVPQEIASALPEEASEAEWQEKVDRAAARINRLGPLTSPLSMSMLRRLSESSISTHRMMTLRRR